MPNFNEQPNSVNKVEQLKKILDQRLVDLKKVLQEEHKQRFLEQLNELEETIKKTNQEYLEIYNRSMEKAKTIKFDMLRERAVESAEKMYAWGLEFNQKTLDNFIRDCGNL